MNPPDPGSGIPGVFIALFVIVGLLAVATAIWRVTATRRMAERAGLDPDTATAVSLLSDGGMGAAYVASTIASHSRPAAPPPPPPAPAAPAPATSSKPVEERLRELQELKDKGVVTAEEYEAQRQKILGSI